MIDFKMNQTLIRFNTQRRKNHWFFNYVFLKFNIQISKCSFSLAAATSTVTFSYVFRRRASKDAFLREEQGSVILTDSIDKHQWLILHSTLK